MRAGGEAGLEKAVVLSEGGRVDLEGRGGCVVSDKGLPGDGEAEDVHQVVIGKVLHLGFAVAGVVWAEGEARELGGVGSTCSLGWVSIEEVGAVSVCLYLDRASKVAARDAHSLRSTSVLLFFFWLRC